jgi:hypothetical protein
MSIFNYNPTHKKWDHTSPVQPNVEHSEGIRPAIEWKPAAYLAVTRFDKHYEDWFVIETGKLAALDSSGKVVPAGLALQAAAYKTAFEANANADELGACKTAARAVSGLTKYTANDVAVGMKNSAGYTAALDEPVVESFFTFGTPAVNISQVALASTDTFGDSDVLVVATSVSKPIGIVPYNFWRWAGGDGSNPANYNYHNYNMQHQVAVLCDYVVELPIVLDTNYANASLPGIAAAIYTTGAPFVPGEFVKCDMNSNMVKADVSSDSFFDIVGQILEVDTTFPKDYLDRVRTAYTNLTALDKTPGSATGGLPDNIFFAAGTAAEGVARINLINR